MLQIARPVAQTDMHPTGNQEVVGFLVRQNFSLEIDHDCFYSLSPIG